MLIKNDQGVLTGEFDVIGLKNGKWESEHVSFKDGNPDEQSTENMHGMEAGFSLPLMVKDGEVVPLMEYVSDPRLLADARNVFNYGVKEGLQGEFWQLIRPFLAETSASTSRLQKGSLLVTSAEVPDADTARLSEIIEESSMDDTFFIRRNPQKPEKAQLLIMGKLPLNRIPLFGIGYDKEKI